MAKDPWPKEHEQHAAELASQLVETARGWVDLPNESKGQILGVAAYRALREVAPGHVVSMAAVLLYGVAGADPGAARAALESVIARQSN